MSTVAEGAPPGPGARLRRAREARELSLQEVADSLNLSARTVSLLEAEAWSELPRAAFTRGYLRTFARLVGENSDQILDGYTAAVGGDSNAMDFKRSDIEGGGITDVIHKQPGTVLSGAVVAAALVTAVVLWIVWPEESARSRSAPPPLRPPVSHAPVAAPTSRPVTSAPAREVENDEPPEHAPTEVDVEPPAEATRTLTPSASTEPVTTAVASGESSTNAPRAYELDPDNEELSTIVEDVEDTARVRRITPDGDDSLTMTFSGDCWVEVKNGEGENLYSDLGRSGDVLELVGEAPFRLRLGFAPGVELAFNNERVVLTPHTRNNIASIVLGQ